MTETNRILCCGEALIDMAPDPERSGDTHFIAVTGGAAYNSAIALARLGSATSLVSGLSHDMFGAKLLAELEASGVDPALCPRTHRPTTVAIVDNRSGSPSFSILDEGSAQRMVTSFEVGDTKPAAALFNGYALGVEPCGIAFEEMAKQLASHTVIDVDPNIRAAVITDEAGTRARLGRFLAMADIIKVSNEDLDWLMPGVAIEDAAAGWLRAGASVVLLTEGAKGARAFTGRYELAVPAAKPPRIADAVGAGDTFNAALLAGLQERGLLAKQALKAISRNDLEEIMGFAARAAAITVSRPGANPPWRKEL